ncbi:MAG: hypothetical protein ACREA3_05705 [Nitrosotalea sp.]
MDENETIEEIIEVVVDGTRVGDGAAGVEADGGAEITGTERKGMVKTTMFLYISFLHKNKLYHEANLWPYAKGVRQNTSIMVIQSVTIV